MLAISPPSIAPRSGALRSDWCIDADTRDNVIARRNVMAALWAARLMGLSGPEMTAYAVEVHLADHDVAGDVDVVAKLERDFQARGLPIPARVVREKLWRFHAEALVQAGGTD
jgi:hypothetical protein